MTSKQFIDGFSPRNYVYMALDEERCHIGVGPTIDKARLTYGIETVWKLVEIYINDLCKFVGARRCFDDDQLTELVTIILTQYKYMRVAELGLFFIKFKAGKFGRIYKELYTMDITINLLEWSKECREKQNRYLYEKHERMMNKWNSQQSYIIFK